MNAATPIEAALILIALGTAVTAVTWAIAYALEWLEGWRGGREQ